MQLSQITLLIFHRSGHYVYFTNTCGGINRPKPVQSCVPVWDTCLLIHSFHDSNNWRKLESSETKRGRLTYRGYHLSQHYPQSADQFHLRVKQHRPYCFPGYLIAEAFHHRFHSRYIIRIFGISFIFAWKLTSLYSVLLICGTSTSWVLGTTSSSFLPVKISIATRWTFE